MSNTRPTVLVIDDDAEFAELLAAIIEETGCRAIVALDGLFGLTLAGEINPSMILCDFSMPGLDGADIMRALHENPTMSDVPRVLMSGHGCPDLRVIPADAFISKPIDTHSLKRLLRAFTRPQPLSMVERA